MIKPTKRFFQFHGNYGGFGNQGGKPIDKLDEACYFHDMACGKAKSPDDRLKADNDFIRKVKIISEDRKEPKNIRDKASIIITVFKYFKP